MEFKNDMIFIWNTSESFKRHVNEMKQFSDEHKNSFIDKLYIMKDMPRPGSFELVNTEGDTRFLISPSRKSTLVQLWEVELPKGVQN
jgi:hypothetical protein